MKLLSVSCHALEQVTFFFAVAIKEHVFIRSVVAFKNCFMGASCLHSVRRFLHEIDHNGARLATAREKKEKVGGGRQKKGHKGLIHI